MGLKVFFLEIVHPDLDSGKVWEFSIFSFCTPPGEISGLPLLRTEVQLAAFFLAFQFCILSALHQEDFFFHLLFEVDLCAQQM